MSIRLIVLIVVSTAVFSLKDFIPEPKQALIYFIMGITASRAADYISSKMTSERSQSAVVRWKSKR